MKDWLCNQFSPFAGQENEFSIGWQDANVIAVRVQSHTTNIDLNPGYNMEVLWTNWHRHCFTWKASGQIKVCVGNY